MHGHILSLGPGSIQVRPIGLSCQQGGGFEEGREGEGGTDWGRQGEGKSVNELAQEERVARIQWDPKPHPGLPGLTVDLGEF